MTDMIQSYPLLQGINMSSNHGGKRDGAGRPSKWGDDVSETKTIRIPADVPNRVIEKAVHEYREKRKEEKED